MTPRDFDALLVPSERPHAPLSGFFIFASLLWPIPVMAVVATVLHYLLT